MTACQVQVFLLLILIILGKAEDLNEGNGNNNNKFNVVLFLAKTNTCETYSQDSGIRFLQFTETKRVKHCATSITENQPVETCTSQGNDCEELLKTGIYSLISFCRNTMGMTTAVASVDNDTFSDGLRFRKSTSEDLEIRYHHPRNIRSRFGVSSNQKIQPDSHLITQPEHTEVFRIRSKREFHIDNNNQGMTPVDENDPNFDIFGIMANIKLTFFGKLFDQEKPANQKPIAQLQNNVMNQIGKVSENSLFDLVKETLNNVQDCQNGFLMIVIGGCLKDISDIYSPLMQSVKHIVENTDPQSTLIVLTGQCPAGENNNNQEFTIPVYTRGPPKCSGIAVSEQLYDVPYAIKNMLTENYGGSFFPNIKSKRSKRNTQQKRNSASPTHPSFLFTLFLAYLTTF
ncbi:uncharacterized protein LOC123015575 [Tribolium madens]|uniref:uncharacterized protein LOC123015575 n=1 Tax=Tribolium madens TaxID=41895 RepID=UPI001CF739D7|nr:uncharacterized protein LOC123015575 [Tribolium madens]